MAGLAASPVGGTPLEVAGQGVIGGAKNEAMGGKFQDGFLAAAASSAAQFTPGANDGLFGLIKMSVVGGTASSLGGGKFANGASVAAFQYLVTSGITQVNRQNSMRGEWIFPDGRSQDINDYDAVITNGILGDREGFLLSVNKYEAPGYFNPSHGFIIDVLESGWQKFLGFAGDPLTEGFADGLKGLDHPIKIYGHSQGTLTATNASLIYGAVPKGSTFILKSPAISNFRASGVSFMNGSGLQYKQPFGDGANLWAPSLNPIKFASGLLDIPRGFKTHITNGL